ncbi:MAG: TPM domain-containing protein [Bacteroidetes bacterium]|nr:TPM domain-containing protein [Bacteroidota bacterium]MCY4205008.1 TPM domain-containing protein [Bacteroidota bacterium]
MKSILTEAELDRIKEAVATAEKQTSGEIVPYIVQKSARHEVAIWRGAGLFALLAYAIVLGIRWFSGWGGTQLTEGITPVLLIIVTGCIGAMVVHWIPGVKRYFAGRARLAFATHQRAMQAFVEKEVFLTRERTGILLFVSLFEHRIEVVGDTGINSKVDSDDWVDIVATIQRHLKSGQLAEGLVEGIQQCGHLLEKAGVTIRSDDTNELADDVSFGV